MTEVTDVIEEAASEVAELVIEDVVSDPKKYIALGFAGGAVVGVGATFLILRKRFETKYQAIADEEIASMRDHFHAKATAMENKPALDGLVKDLGYVPAVEAEVLTVDPALKPSVLPQEMRNVFEDHAKEPGDDWDYEVEVAQRSPERPYIIHMDEKGETGYDMTTLTYYEDDDVLADHRDQVIEDRELLVGESNLDKFGHGSDSADTLYIRNDGLSIELEICRSGGSYAQEVHGFEPPELKHSHRRRRSHDEE